MESGTGYPGRHPVHRPSAAPSIHSADHHHLDRHCLCEPGRFLLYARIPFVQNQQSAEKIKYTWIKDGKFKIEIQDAKKNTKYNYSIYWVWPLNLSTILLNNGDGFLNGNTVEFDDKDSTGKLRSNIVTDMAEYPNKYFFSSLTGRPLNKEEYEEVKEIPNIHKNSGKSDTYNKQLFVDLSSYYNQADMKIGSGISFVTATLKYLGTSETTNETTEAQNER